MNVAAVAQMLDELAGLADAGRITRDRPDAVDRVVLLDHVDGLEILASPEGGVSLAARDEAVCSTFVRELFASGLRIEDLRVRAVGDRVEAGDLLFDLYAPEITIASSELMRATRRRDADEIAIDLKAAASGAGRSLKEHLLFSELFENVKGYSLGGMLSLQIAADGRLPLQRFVLIGSTPKFTAGDDWPFGLPLTEVRAMARNLKRRFEATLGEFFSLTFAGETLSVDRLRTIRPDAS